MRKGIWFVAVAALPGCATWSDSYLVGVRTGNSGQQLEPPQFYRVSMWGEAFLQSTRFQSGWHDKEAVDQLFADVVGKVAQVNRELASQADAAFKPANRVVPGPLDDNAGNKTKASRENGQGTNPGGERDGADTAGSQDTSQPPKPETPPSEGAPKSNDTKKAGNAPPGAEPSDSHKPAGALKVPTLSSERDSAKSFLVFGPQGQTIDPTDRRLVIFAVSNPRALVNAINQFVDQGTMANAMKSVLLKDALRELDEAKSADASDAKEHEIVRSVVTTVKTNLETEANKAQQARDKEASERNEPLTPEKKNKLDADAAERRTRELAHIRDLANRVLDQVKGRNSEEAKR